MKKKVLLGTACLLWVAVLMPMPDEPLNAAEPARAVLSANVSPKHPTLYKMLGRLPVKLTKAGAVYTGEARVTLESTGWVNILFNPIGDVSTNGFAIKLSNYTNLVVVDDEGSLTVSTNEDNRLKTWRFDEVSDKLALKGDITLSYLPSQGLLNISLSGGGLRFTAAMIVEMIVETQELNSMANEECPGGTCSCGGGDDCEACCSEGFHPHCECHLTYDKCECLENAGMAMFMMAPLN